MTRIAQRLQAQHGTAMVEMALVMPILVVLAVGIVDFGRAMNYWNDVNQIAADGARFAAVSRNPGDDPATTGVDVDFREWLRSQAITGELKDGVLAGGNAANCPDSSDSTCSQSVTRKLRVCIESGATPAEPLTIGHPIRIRVESAYNFVPFHLLPGIDKENDVGSVNLKGAAVMRLEQNYDPDKMGPAGCLPA
jgi:Flp pilus assembly protein TadG